MQLSFIIEHITGKEADDLALDIIMYLKEQGYMVSDYSIEEDSNE